MQRCVSEGSPCGSPGGSPHRTGTSEDEQNTAQSHPTEGQRRERFTASSQPSLVRADPWLLTPHSSGPPRDGSQKLLGRREFYAVQLKRDAVWLHLCEAVCPAMAGVKFGLRGYEAGHRDV